MAAASAVTDRPRRAAGSNPGRSPLGGKLFHYSTGELRSYGMEIADDQFGAMYDTGYALTAVGLYDPFAMDCGCMQPHRVPDIRHPDDGIALVIPALVQHAPMYESTAIGMMPFGGYLDEYVWGWDQMPSAFGYVDAAVYDFGWANTEDVTAVRIWNLVPIPENLCSLVSRESIRALLSTEWEAMARMAELEVYGCQDEEEEKELENLTIALTEQSTDTEWASRYIKEDAVRMTWEPDPALAPYWQRLTRSGLHNWARLRELAKHPSSSIDIKAEEMFCPWAL